MEKERKKRKMQKSKSSCHKQRVRQKTNKKMFKKLNIVKVKKKNAGNREVYFASGTKNDKIRTENREKNEKNIILSTFFTRFSSGFDSIFVFFSNFMARFTWRILLYH